MYLGIDLGTSNSAIAGHDGTAVRLFKTADGSDLLPSAVLIDRRGNLMVGRRAYDQSAFAPNDVAQGFKRLMGTSSELTFASTGRTMTPEEASTEIIKALVAQAGMALGELAVTGAAVTVPAAFNQMQSEATMRSAEAAGLSAVALIQEPIAAAMASIAHSEAKSGQFLVYDLGGGTFDAALVQSIAGVVTIIGHSGINMLGGRDFDRALVNEVVRPWLLDTFSLPDNFHTEERYQRLVRVALCRAEIAKVALSTQTQDRIFADESQTGARDLSGREIYLDVEITRTQLEALIGGEIDRSIAHCRSLIEDSGFEAAHIDRVVMIGGPSRMPIVRHKVEQELGIRVDHGTDPMTAVAFGAAIYAEGRNWGSAGVTTKRTRTSAHAASAIDLRLDYPARTSEQAIRLRLRCAGPSFGYRAEIRTENGWTSGLVILGEQTDVTGIPLEKGVNRLRVSVLDPQGMADAKLSRDIEIQRLDALTEGMPLMHSIAVKVVSGGIGTETNELETLVEKGTSLPKSGQREFRAAKDLRSGDHEIIDIELFEQAEGVVDPELNLAIGSFRLSSALLERGDVIRRGESIFVDWTIDANGLLNCRVSVPSINAVFDGLKLYVSAVGHRSFDGEDGRRIATEAVRIAREDVDTLERALGVAVSREIAELRARLAKLSHTMRLSSDADTFRSVAEEARAVRQDVSRVRSKPEHRARIALQELDDLHGYFVGALSRFVDERTAYQVHRLVGMARDALKRNTEQSTRDAVKTTRELVEVIRAALYKTPDFWIDEFHRLAEERHLAVDQQRHDDLTREGQRAANDRRIDGLRRIIVELAKNIVRPGKVAGSDVLAGLMRA